MVAASNGLLSPPQTERAPSVSSSPPRIVLAGKTGRILCVADIRGDYHELNRLIREHDATAVIHTGDFGFLNADSVEGMSEPMLRHLLQYCPLIPPATRSQLLAIPEKAPRNEIISALNNSSIHFPLSQFPHLLSGAITFPVPVFTVYGLIEDIHIIEKFRTGEYEVHNLTLIDEACSALIETGGIKLRLLGLGGALSYHKLFDHGEGKASIAGARGTMWFTALQLGELVDTAQRTFDPTEIRLFLSASPVPRHGLLGLLANAVKADMTISGGLHLASNGASHSEPAAYRNNFLTAQKTFMDVYTAVKDKVDVSVNDEQRSMLKNALSVVADVPENVHELMMNVWNWVLTDASSGHVLLSINNSRVSVETRSNGINFAHRSAQTSAQPTAPQASNSQVLQQQSRSNQDTPPTVKAAPSRFGANPVQPGLRQTNAQSMPANNNKTPLARPQQPAAPSKPSMPSVTPSAPVNGHTSTPNRPSPQPPTQPRNSRSQVPSAAAGLKSTDAAGKPAEAPTTRSPAPGSSKPNTPAPSNATPASQPNGKSAPPGRKEDKSKSAASKKDAAASTPVNGEKKEEKKDEEKKGADKAADATAAKKDGEEKTASTDKPDGPVVGPPKKNCSLYIKGIPIPTSEEEIKSLFPNPSKISHVKIIVDHVSGVQKNFAYADFELEADTQTALENASTTIRDTTVTVQLSNPPARPSNMRGRGGFRGSFRGGGRSGGSGRKETAKAD